MGQDLSALSIEELEERAALLRNEIARLEALVTRKRRNVLQQIAYSAADDFGTAYARTAITGGN